MRRSPWRRAASALAAMVAASLLLVGCVTVPQIAPHGVIRVGMTEPTVPITPENADDPIVARILPALTAGLVAVLPDGSIALELAESITTRDNRVFDVAIAPRAAFGDGTPVTSASFVDAWQRAALVGSGSPQRSAYSAIQGYVPEPTPDLAPEEDVPTGDLVAGGGLTVVDDTHFRITLSNARPEFPAELGKAAFLPAFGPLAASPSPSEVRAFGAGPYRVVASVPGDRLELEPNPGYVGPRRPQNAGVSLRWFSSTQTALAELVAGELDAVDRLPAGEAGRWKRLLDGRVVTQPLPVVYSLVLPSELSGLRGEEGRLRVGALALSIDRTRVAEEVLGGDAIPATDFLPVSIPSASIPVRWMERANDINARRSWDQADDFGVWEPTFTIAVVDGTVGERIAEALAERFLTALAVETIVLRFESQEALDATVEEEDLVVFRIRRSEAVAPVIPDSLWRTLAGSVPSSVRDLLAAAAAEKDPVDAARLAAAAQQPLAADPPLLPIAELTVSAAYAEGLRGARLDWRGALDLPALASEGPASAPAPTLTGSPSPTPSAGG